MSPHESASRMSLAASLRQVFTQLLRLLEEQDPTLMLRDGSAFVTALEGWRKTVVAQTSGISTQRARTLEQDKLEMMARVAQLQKERDDLQLRNKEILAELIKSKKKEDQSKQELVHAQFAGSGHRAEAKALDLEVRELRRRIRELEGGPPLSAEEAAPQSKGETGVADVPPPATGPVELDQSTGEVNEAESPTVPSVQDRRADAEAAFRAMWKPKDTDDERAAPSSPAEPADGPADAGAVPAVAAAPDRSKKPAAKKPEAKKPGAKKPAAKNPAAKKPEAKKPAAKKPVAKKSAAKKPAAKKSAAKKPAVKKPVAKKSAANKPVVKKPAVKKPAAKKPAAKNPAAKNPAAKKPEAKKPAAKNPAAKKPAAKNPAAKKPAAKKPAAKKPAAKKPAAKNPAAKKPAAKKPAAKKPVAKKPVPTTAKQDAPRRGTGAKNVAKSGSKAAASKAKRSPRRRKAGSAARGAS